MFDQMIGQLKAELAADKKKATILGLLGVVGLFMLLKLVLGAGSGPAKAGASIIPAKNSSSSTGLAMSKPAMQKDISEYLTAQQVDLSRNIFAADFKQFPAGEIVERDEEVIVKPINDKKIGANLVLQSTLNLTRPTAIINDKVLTVGDRIEDCEVVKVAEGFCILRSGNTEFTLEIKSLK